MSRLLGRVLYSYGLIALALVSAMAGIQLPNFVKQYEQRVDAHLVEVEKNLRGFQQIADQFHAGSLTALIQKHESSSDPTFAAEAKPIRDMVLRRDNFLSQAQALRASAWERLRFIAFEADPILRQETWRMFSPAVMLNESAITFALVFALVCVGITDLLLRTLRRLVG